MGSGRGIRAIITKRACARLTLLLVLLVGGAIVNFAVAWADGIPMRIQRHARSNPPFWLFFESATFGWPAATAEGLDRYKPIWPGFAINTVFYAFTLWLLFALGTPFALRRRLRVKRGLCPKCAYDLRGHSAGGDVCPECGAAIKVNCVVR